MTTATRKAADVQRELAEATNRVAELTAELDALAVTEEEARLAELIHANYCRYNHTDGCSWGYERGNWANSVHQQYLDRAREALKATPFDTAIALANVFAGKPVDHQPRLYN